MTFSQKDVVDLVRDKFVAVWESVAPVRVAVFDLGGGKSIKGTVGGEIAIYLCRPDGKVFDIIPALQSPQVTYWMIQNSLKFMERTFATDKAVRDYHASLYAQMVAKGLGKETPGIIKSKRDLKRREMTWDPGTHDLARMVGSKTGIMEGGEPIVVVEPGGLDYFRRKVHERMAATAPLTPQEWKKVIFEEVLDQELKGGTVEYKVDTLAPFSIIEE